MAMLTCLKCCFSASRPLCIAHGDEPCECLSELMAGEPPGASRAYGAGVVIQAPADGYAAGRVGPPPAVVQRTTEEEMAVARPGAKTRRQAVDELDRGTHMV